MNYSIPVLIVNSKSNFSIKCIEKTVSSIQALSSSAKGEVIPSFPPVLPYRQEE